MIDIKENVSLAELTSFRIGGLAKYFVQIKSLEELKEAINFSRENKIEFYIIGSGTNLLVNDGVFEGLIIQMKMNNISVEDGLVFAEAGVPLIKAVNFSACGGLSGMEQLAGIPGTVGGAVRGNAGAFGTEIRSVVKKVTALNVENQNIEEFLNQECGFLYRSSVFKKNKNLIVLSTILELQKDEVDKVQEKVQETIVKRTSRGLHGVKSAGSFFMNPVVENNQKLLDEFEKETGSPARNNTVPAGWLIERAGLLGKQIGGAQVSPQHANYVINATGTATAENVIMLVSVIKQQVRDQFGVQLQEEVNYLGF
ncbi:MAG: UDP-N-acetylenolpyruvoylglucosamine reductase [uncultured bacterium]|nr:MAG: UDP-N-acetylenolpyruvoylglucosamine reductase [uncultured bacterium]